MIRLLSKLVGAAAIVGAWVFIVVSVVGIAGVPVQLADPEVDAVNLMSVIQDGVTHTPWGLSYAGSRGAGLAMAQAALVIASFVASLARGTGYRRLGHLGLLLWASLFLGNAVWFYRLGGEFPRNMLILYAAFWLCVLIRAAKRWAPRPRRMVMSM